MLIIIIITEHGVGTSFLTVVNFSLSDSDSTDRNMVLTLQPYFKRGGQVWCGIDGVGLAGFKSRSNAFLLA